MKSSSLALVVLIIALLIGGGLYVYDRQIAQEEASFLNNSIGSDTSQADSTADQSGTLSAPQKIDLSAVSGVEAAGIANRVYANNEFILTINADLPKVESGTSYTGWAENIVGGQQEIVSLGRLNDEGDSFYLEYRIGKDMSDYSHIYVMRENGTDEMTKVKILEGQF